MRERYKDKPQEMQQEMMKIYREEKVNPLGGCFPILVQMPGVHRAVLGAAVQRRDARRPVDRLDPGPPRPDPFFILPMVMTLTTLLQTG
jgi:YidC/Oxa1 family membrane protein insertase